jgi:hypothetical protein
MSDPTFLSANGERRVKVRRIDGQQSYLVEKRGNLMGHGNHFSGSKDPCWYILTETADVNVVAFHVNLSTLKEVVS